MTFTATFTRNGATETVNIPETITVALGKDTGKSNVVRLLDIPAKVLATALVEGFTGALNNISKGTTDSKGNKVERTVDQWLDARDERAGVWYTGDWKRSGGGGDRDTLPLRDVYYNEQNAVDSRSKKKVDEEIRKVVTERFGPKENATFSIFLDCIAAQMAEAGDRPAADYRAALQGHYESEARKLVAARTAPKIDISAMMSKLKLPAAE